MRRSEVDVVRRAAEGELVGVGLAEDDRARTTEAVDGRRVLGRNALAEGARARSSHDARRVVQVLDRDRDAVERSEPRPRKCTLLGCACLGERRVAHQPHVRVDAVLRLVDAREDRLRERHGGEVAVLDAGARLRDAEIAKVEFGGGLGHRAVLRVGRNRLPRDARDDSPATPPAHHLREVDPRTRGCLRSRAIRPPSRSTDD